MHALILASFGAQKPNTLSNKLEKGDGGEFLTSACGRSFSMNNHAG